MTKLQVKRFKVREEEFGDTIADIRTTIAYNPDGKKGGEINRDTT